VEPSSHQDTVSSWVKTLWKGRALFLITVLVCLLVGVALALFTPKEYTSWTTLVPQTNDRTGGQLSGMSSLAAIAGFNLDLSKGGDLSPAVYPQIVASSSFQLELMQSLFHVAASDSPMTLLDYYALQDGGKRSVGRQAAAGFSQAEMDTAQVATVRLSAQQEAVSERLNKQLSMNVDTKNGFITIQSRFPEPLLAAEVADRTRVLLQQHITRHRLLKATEQLVFIEESFLKKKADVHQAQRTLAYFHDNNKYLTDATPSIEEERLKSEYTIALSVYNELAKRLEEAKIQVKEDTPAFSVIQAAKVPLKPSKPNKLLTVTVWLFLGLLLGGTLVFGQAYLAVLRVNWKH
jgi:uncharacterized protein involved in exopolysaccharide biosynthesis